MIGEALVVAATLDGGTVTALQPFEGGTILGRLVAQLGSLGFREVTVITRAGHGPAVKAALEESATLHDGSPDAVTTATVESPDLAGDLEAAAGVAARATGRLLVLSGDIVMHREALAGLVADPRIVSGVLTTSVRPATSHAFRLRSRRGRVTSAGSRYHRVSNSTSYVLNVFTVDGGARASFADAARTLSALADDPPAAWQEEDRRRTEDRRTRADLALARLDENPDLSVDERAEASAAIEAALVRRTLVSDQDAVALLLVGLIRSGASVTPGYLRKLFWARPIGPEALQRASEGLARIDEDAVLLASAVKANDGFFTTYCVSPYSRYIARWAARRGWTPNWVTTLSMGLGIAAGLAFALGDRLGLVAGAVLLQVAFVFDCVDGQLARYTRQFSKLGAWLDSVFDRGKEYVVFAGLAVGAARSGDDVWLLAAAALALQTVRHLMDFSYAAAQHGVIRSLPILPLDEPRDRIPRAARAGGLPAAAPVTGSPAASLLAPARAVGAVGTAGSAGPTATAPAAAGSPVMVSARAGTSTDTEDAGALDDATATDDATAALEESRPDWLADADDAADTADPADEGVPSGAPGAVGATGLRRVVRRRARKVVRFWHGLDRRPGWLWIKRIVLLPIGERFALISVVAAFATPRAVFVALLAWGGFALVYGLTGRALRSVAM